MDDDAAAMSRLQWDEYPHVKRAVKRTLECNVVRRELAYASAHAQAVDLYRMERAVRAAEGDPLAATLDRMPPCGPYPCAVSAALFTANYDVQSLLVSQDPLVKRAEELLRATIQTLAAGARAECTFGAVLAAYLDFAAKHRDRLVATSSPAAATSPAASPALLAPPVSPMSPVSPVHPVSMPPPPLPRRRLPLGLQPYVTRLGDATVTFPTAAAWAAFVANKTLWQRLPGAPPPATLMPTDVPRPTAAATSAARPPRRPPRALDFAPVRRVSSAADAPRWRRKDDDDVADDAPPPLPVFVLAPDLEAWEAAHT